jgi:protein-tyrosine-phosphatase
MPSILFVCTGNICRSPMAEAIARHRLAARGRDDVTVASAGSWALAGRRATPEAAAALAELDVAGDAHRARRLSRELIGAADRIYCLTGEHVAAVLELDPAADRKTELLAPAGTDIADPYGQDAAFYREIRDEIAAAVDERLEEWPGSADADVEP